MKQSGYTVTIRAFLPAEANIPRGGERRGATAGDRGQGLRRCGARLALRHAAEGRS